MPAVMVLCPNRTARGLTKISCLAECLGNVPFNEGIDSGPKWLEPKGLRIICIHIDMCCLVVEMEEGHELQQEQEGLYEK